MYKIGCLLEGGQSEGQIYFRLLQISKTYFVTVLKTWNLNKNVFFNFFYLFLGIWTFHGVLPLSQYLYENLMFYLSFIS